MSNLEQWKQLLNLIEIEEPIPKEKVNCPKDCSIFEEYLGFTLPVAYQEFCHIFGTGRFGDIINLECPDWEYIKYQNDAIKNIKNDVEEAPFTNQEEKNEYLNLLNSCFMFGSNDWICIAIWDLRTYSPIDDSYDIYWIDIETFGNNFFRIGRNFYEFIHDFCLGFKSYNFIPEEMRPNPSPEDLIFVRLPPMGTKTQTSHHYTKIFLKLKEKVQQLLLLLRLT